jgi:hypothetical protein
MSSPCAESVLAIGMITCDRRGFDVGSAVKHLRWGGFEGLIHVFCEPGTPEISAIADVVVHRNETRLGCIGNWRHCLAWLLGHTAAAMAWEDDVEYCRGAHNAWEGSLHQIRQVGFWSFYTPRRDRNLVSAGSGWFAANQGRDAWGTQAPSSTPGSTLLTRRSSSTAPAASIRRSERPIRLARVLRKSRPRTWTCA